MCSATRLARCHSTRARRAVTIRSTVTGSAVDAISRHALLPPRDSHPSPTTLSLTSGVISPRAQRAREKIAASNLFLRATGQAFYRRWITLSPSSSAFCNCPHESGAVFCAATSTSRAEISLTHCPRSGTSMARRRNTLRTLRAKEAEERGWSLRARKIVAPSSSRKNADSEQCPCAHRCRL